MTKAAEALGFSVQRGSRFFYLTRAGSESDAFVRVREELHCNLAIALGGSLLDAEFLSRSDFPIIVPGSDGSPDPELIARLPTARIAPAPGSAGWAASMKELLRTVAGTRHPREPQLCGG